MRLIATSDLHGYQPVFSEWGEVIVIAGDLTPRGSLKDTAKFSAWITNLAKKFKHIVFVAGNHDSFFQTTGGQLRSFKLDWKQRGNIHYLEDSGVTIDGVKFWGSPWTPMFHNWAFMQEDAELKKYWDMIPSDTDVLITHGPPQGILDRTMTDYAGSKTLYNRVLLSDLAPKVHIFGHIHGGYGERALGLPITRFFNVAHCDDDYEPVNKPVHILV